VGPQEKDRENGTPRGGEKGERKGKKTVKHKIDK